MEYSESEIERIKLRDKLVDAGFDRTSFTAMDPKDPKKRYKEAWSNGKDRIIISWNSDNF